MTTRIQREFTFQAGVYYDSQFLMNIYEISLCIDVETDSLREQNIAMERISFFLSEYLENGIFVEETEKKVIEKYLASDFKVCTLPAEPYDQIISVMLLLKLNAITEGRFLVTDISLTSKLSDGVSYLHEIGGASGPFATPGWWDDTCASMTNLEKLNKKEKIVKLFRTHTSDWAEFNLSWKEKTPKLIIPDQAEISFEKLPEQL